MSNPLFSAKASLFAGACLTLLAAAPALAAPVTPAMPQVAVTYADLNLNTQKGQRILSDRIENAAHQVCGSAPDARLLRASRDYAQCVHASVTRAIAAISVPEVRTALETMLTNRAGT